LNWKTPLILILTIYSSSLLILLHSQSNRYEFSIYHYTPTAFWILVAILTFLGISTVVISAQEESNSKFLAIGFAALYTMYILVLSIVVIRNYYFWGGFGDPAFHFGEIKDLLVDGHLSDRNLYPITHLISAEICLILNTALLDVHRLLPLVFEYLFPLYVLLFLRELSRKKTELSYSYIIVFAFISNWYINFTPNAFANFYVPITLFLIIKTYLDISKIYAILASITSFFSVFLHPLSAIFIIIFIFSVSIYEHLFGLKLADVGAKRTPKLVQYILLITLISLVFWLYSHYIWGSTISGIYSTIVSETSEAAINDIVTQISDANASGLSAIDIILKRQIVQLIIIGTAILSLPYVLRDIYKGDSRVHIITCVALSLLFFITMMSSFVKMSYGPLRNIYYMVLLSIVFLGYFLNKIFNEKTIMRGSKKYLMSGILILIYCIIFILGVSALYPSDYNVVTSLHTTESEVSGMKHIFTHSDASSLYSGITLTPGRYYDLIYSPKERKLNPQISNYGNFSHPPYHFNYEKSVGLIQYYPKSTHLNIANRDIERFIYIVPALTKHEYSMADFYRLSNDESANKVFMNGGIYSMYIEIT
jgi:hypothetical protein